MSDHNINQSQREGGNITIQSQRSRQDLPVTGRIQNNDGWKHFCGATGQERQIVNKEFDTLVKYRKLNVLHELKFCFKFEGLLFQAVVILC